MSDGLVIRPFSRAELPSESEALARFLLGNVLVHDAADGRLAGRIVETEAYVPNDPSSHCYRGSTARCRSMFLPHGFAYVYRIYGMYRCLNVASEEDGIGAAVLIRAVEPLEGAAQMAHRRALAEVQVRDLARGPARMTIAFGIDAEHDGVDLCAGGPLRLGTAGLPPAEIGTSVRIGITKAAESPLRFYERGSPFVSGPSRLNGLRAAARSPGRRALRSE